MSSSNSGEAVEPVPKSSQATVTWPSVFWLITSCGCESCCGPKLPVRIDGRHAAESQRFFVPDRTGNRSPDDQLGPVGVEVRRGVRRIAAMSAGCGVDAGPGDVDIVRIGVRGRISGWIAVSAATIGAGRCVGAGHPLVDDAVVRDRDLRSA